MLSGFTCSLLITFPVFSEVSVGSVRGAAVEPERLVPVKPEVQVGPGQQNHDPRAQRTYTEELRREPIIDKWVQNSDFSLIITHASLDAQSFTHMHILNHLCVDSHIYILTNILYKNILHMKTKTHLKLIGTLNVKIKVLVCFMLHHAPCDVLMFM